MYIAEFKVLILTECIQSSVIEEAKCVQTNKSIFMKLFNMAFVIHWLVVNQRQKDCVWYFVEWFLMTLERVKKFFVCFSNVFFEINADPFWHFFPHWHLLLHILHEIMQIYKETKISEWLHHVYLYLSLLCRSNLSLSLGLSVPRSFICKPLSLLINYWWQIVELLANQKLLWKNGEVVGGGGVSITAKQLRDREGDV